MPSVGHCNLRLIYNACNRAAAAAAVLPLQSSLFPSISHSTNIFQNSSVARTRTKKREMEANEVLIRGERMKFSAHTTCLLFSSSSSSSRFCVQTILVCQCQCQCLLSVQATTEDHWNSGGGVLVQVLSSSIIIIFSRVCRRCTSVHSSSSSSSRGSVSSKRQMTMAAAAAEVLDNNPNGFG